MKTGELYNRHGKTYMILDLFERSWDFTSCVGEEHAQRHVAHVSCIGPEGLEEFPLEWFCRGAEVINEAW